MDVAIRGLVAVRWFRGAACVAASEQSERDESFRPTAKAVVRLGARFDELPR